MSTSFVPHFRIAHPPRDQNQLSKPTNITDDYREARYKDSLNTPVRFWFTTKKKIKNQNLILGLSVLTQHISSFRLRLHRHWTIFASTRAFVWVFFLTAGRWNTDSPPTFFRRTNRQQTRPKYKESFIDFFYVVRFFSKLGTLSVLITTPLLSTIRSL